MASVSRKYEVVRQNYPNLTEGIPDGLREVVLKAFSRNLITPETKNECLNDSNPTDGRAEKLLDAVLRKIKLNPTVFDDFVSILQEIPALNYLAERLKDDLSHGSDRGCSDVGERSSSSEYQTHTAAKRLKGDRSSGRSKKAVSDNIDDVDSAVADLSLADDGPGYEEAESETPKLAHVHNSAHNVPMSELYTFPHDEDGQENHDMQTTPEDLQLTSKNDSSNETYSLQSTQESGCATNHGSLVSTGSPHVNSSPSMTTLSSATISLENKPTKVANRTRLQEQENESELRKKNAQIANLEENGKKLAQQLEKTTKEKEQTEKDLKSKEEELDKVSNEKECLKENIQKMKNEMEDLRHRLAEKEKENSDVRKQFEKRIAVLQKQVDDLSDKEEKTKDELIRVLKEKHELELKLRDMEKNEAELRIKLETEKRLNAANTKAVVAEVREKYAREKAQDEEERRKQEETRRKDVEEEWKKSEERRRNSELRTEELERKLAHFQSLQTHK